MPLPLAVIAMVLILAGFALYVMLAFRLFKRLRTALQQRGYKGPVVLTGAGVAAFTLPFVRPGPRGVRSLHLTSSVTCSNGPRALGGLSILAYLSKVCVRSQRSVTRSATHINLLDSHSLSSL